MDIDKMSKSELEAQQVIKEQEYQEAIHNLAAVEIEDNKIAIEVAELQLKRKRLKDAMIQGSSNVRRCNSELRSIKCLIYKRLSGE